MSRETVKRAIGRFEKFLISSHINPEGDAIGSQIAMSSLLKRLGKKVVSVNDNPVPHTLRFMKGSEDILKEMPRDFNFDSAMILDSPDLTRIGRVANYISSDKPVINIDHHISNQRFARYNWVAPNVSSAGEMVFRSEERRVGKECRSRWSPYH